MPRATFMSHAHADNAICAQYATALRARGIDVWIDLVDAQVGHSLSGGITQQLERRSALLLMVTAASNASYWVELERDNFIHLWADKSTHVVDGVERVILPVRLNASPIPAAVRGFLGIDAVGKPFAQVVDEIARALGAVPSDAPLSIPQHGVGPTPPTWREIALPTRLDNLGFAAYRDTAKNVSFIIPPVCAVPAGKFTMGSDPNDPQAYDSEKGQFNIFVDAFEIGTYPVTVAEYAQYLAANTQVTPPPDASFDKDDKNVAAEWRGKTLTWAIQQQQRADHPVVCVMWQDARDYAAWLASVTGQPWRLPTEAEWEKAARGTDAWVYPWGNQWDKTRANTNDGGPGKTTSVGSYARLVSKDAQGREVIVSDASLYGVHDLAGGVWEWTSTAWYDTPPYDFSKYENISPYGRVSRGGSWWRSPLSARAAHRFRDNSSGWYDYRGFRLARGRVDR